MKPTDPQKARPSAGDTLAPPAAGQAAHTPTPWQIMPSQRSNLLHVEASPDTGRGGEPVCSIPKSRKQDAAFIVRACNSHAGLVEALLHARRLIASRDVVKDRAALRMYDETIFAADPAKAGAIDSDTIRGLQARAALQSAKP